MREIGGYMEFESYHMPMLHDRAIGLNCGRNCLAYLIKAKGIRKIALPYFLCESVRNVCFTYQVSVRYYCVDESLLPVNVSLDSGEYLYLVDYYGQISAERIQNVINIYKNVIVDYTQAYFAGPAKGADSIYSCRKFFGVADGGFLYTDQILGEELEYDESYERMKFIMGRYERTAQEFYEYSVKNNQMFSEAPLKKMSKLTENILHSIDYKKVEEIRTENYRYLLKRLKDINQLQLQEISGAFSYPCMVDHAPLIRARMIEHKIYIPVLWANVLEDTDRESWDYRLANNILSLPCDQRYREEEMDFICRTLIEEMEKSV